MEGDTGTLSPCRRRYTLYVFDVDPLPSRDQVPPRRTPRGHGTVLVEVVDPSLASSNSTLRPHCRRVCFLLGWTPVTGGRLCRTSVHCDRRPQPPPCPEIQCLRPSCPHPEELEGVGVGLGGLVPTSPASARSWPRVRDPTRNPLGVDARSRVKEVDSFLFHLFYRFREAETTGTAPWG